MIIRRGGEPSGVGSLRAGASGVGRLRAGTLEARSLGGSPAAMSSVAVPCFNSCSVPNCNYVTCVYLNVFNVIMLL